MRQIKETPNIIGQIFLRISVLSLVFLFACEEPSFVGSEIQPETDRLDLRHSDDSPLRSLTETFDSLETNRLRHSVVGELNDPVFGDTKGSFATQLGLFESGHTFGVSPEIDSLVLHLKYTDFYGQRDVPQEIRVYELTDSLMYDSVYYADFDISGMYDPARVIGSKSYTSAENDSMISIPITDTEFQEKLLEADTTDMASSMNFLEYMKGLYVVAESQGGEGGCLYKVDLLSDDSRMTMYYSNAAADELSFDYIVNEGAARVNMYDHDHSQTDFYDQLNSQYSDDSLVYVQGIGGLMAKVELEDLSTWRDSVPVAINSARLIIEPAEIDEGYPLPRNLIAYHYTEDGDFYPVVDYMMGESYFGGRYDDENDRYTLNITSFVQHYIKERVDTEELYIMIEDNRFVPGRVVLKGAGHSEPMRLEIKYNRF